MNSFVTAQQRIEWDENGFFLVPGLFDAAWRDGFQAWLESLAARRHELAPAQFVLEPNAAPDALPMAAIRKVNALHLHPQSLEFCGPNSPGAAVAAKLIGESDLLFGSSAFTKPAGFGSETPWHQDQMLWALWEPRAVSCWVALDECTPENGCLQFVRGSHRDGVEEHVTTPAQAHPHIPKERVPQERVALMEMEPGDAVFFGGLTWHYSDPNRSSQRRLGTVAVYNGQAHYKTAHDNAAWVQGRSALEMSIGKQPKTPFRIGAEAVKSVREAVMV